MAKELKGRRVAILVADGFEQIEMTEPKKALDAAGAETVIVSPAQGKVQGFSDKEMKKADAFPVGGPLPQTRPENFDALVLPGGVMNPDKLRLIPEAVAFVQHFVEAGKPIAAICHGPWTLINASGVRGHKMTSWPSLESDLRNAGADWTDAPVIVDRMLVTSRKPADLPQFCAKMIETFAAADTMHHHAA
ncbi:MAG TPA: type 1 glutamine amidotransferase domain-containing protein [Methylovirgula sp.]|nr:type 1 glutamine amidotransferase domain-containing protein [Methylovirgula sp.]